MALVDSTAAERAEFVAACNMAAKYLNVWTEDYFFDTTNTTLVAAYQAYVTRVSNALTALTN
ncbi:hypothetical protein forsur_24 [Escherichia phage forsur]|uniref:Uncharacterized protein n=1 Tax=Escherichia phage usur TaxID=2696459 RepID=A0A6B9X8D2_9CAUD|nr:hypothetical protein forsur_24 [Escherichia phage forsur]QHR72931.1 hypothetical protein usur_4 [Escherichia phage usur]